MSVSLSSVYEQTESLKQIQQLFDEALKNEAKFEFAIKEVVSQACNLTMSQAYRLVVILSKYLSNNTTVMKKYASLYALKQLLLTAYHHFYIFVSIRALSWISNITKFQSRKSEFERAKSYLKQVALKGNGDEVLQERHCYKLFKLVDQFLPWFADNIPTHINAQFQFRSTFLRTLQELPTRKSITNYEHFTPQQFNKFEYNFNVRRGQNRQLIRQLCEFVALELRILIDQQKYKSELLTQIVKAADSHCIKAIVAELCNLLQDSSKLFHCLKIAQNLMNVGEIQFIQLGKLYIVPSLLTYVLPVDFVQGKKLTKPINSCSLSEQKCIIDCIYIWRKITEKVGLQVDFYNQIISEMERQKKGVFNVQQKHLADFLTNVIDMEGVNSDKKQYVQNADLEKRLIQTLNSRGDGNIIKQAPKLNLNTSAINQLDDFKESRAQKIAKASQQSVNSGIFNFNFQSFGLQKNNNIGSNTLLQSPKRGLTLVSSNPPQIVTFKNTQVSKEIQSQIKSPYKNSIQVDPSLKVIEQSSYMAFDMSNLSKFSEYSVKKSKQQSINYNQILAPKLQTPKQVGSPSSRNSKFNELSGSSSGSVVYFGKSEQFHSQNTSNIQNFDKKKENSRLSYNNQSQRSLKLNQLNQDNASTYKFDSSSFSNSSASNSDIKNFGKDNQYFPQTVPKPNFGFKKKIMVQQNNQQYKGDYENILTSQIRQKNQNEPLRMSNGRKQYFQFRDSQHSQQSQIKDLSGGRHRLEQSIEALSERSDDPYKRSRIFVKSKKNDVNNFKASPQGQYYQQIQLTKQNFNNLGKGKPYSLQQNAQQNKIRIVKSQKNLLGPQQLKPGNLKQYHYDELNEVRSDQEIPIRKKPLIIDQFSNDRLLGLQKQLGKAMQQKNRKQIQLKKKDDQYRLLKSKSIPYMGKKIDLLKKENQIIKLLVGQKNKQDYGIKVADVIKPIKNQNKMSDYFLQNEVSGNCSLVRKPYDRTFTKQILGSRCLLLANEYLQLGYNYSQRQNQVSLYLTFHKIFDLIHIKVNQNSIIFEKPVDLGLQNQPAGYQLKIKRKVKRIINNKKQLNFSDVMNKKSDTTFKFPQMLIKISNQSGEEQSFQIIIPCSILNLAEPIQIDMDIIQKLKGKKVVNSDSLPLSVEFGKNWKDKIDKYFPLHMKLVDGWYLMGYRFPQSIFSIQQNQFIKFRPTADKSVEYQFFNDPKSLLVESLVNVMTSP